MGHSASGRQAHNTADAIHNRGPSRHNSADRPSPTDEAPSPLAVIPNPDRGANLGHAPNRGRPTVREP
jgi:hypothetical protein